MRLGKVCVLHGYVVDLDNPEQVERAKAFLKSDLCQMAVHPDRDADLDKAIGTSTMIGVEGVDIDKTECSEQFHFTDDPEDYVHGSSYEGLPSGDGEPMLLDPGGHVVTMDDAIEMERMSLLRENIINLRNK